MKIINFFNYEPYVQVEEEIYCLSHFVRIFMQFDEACGSWAKFSFPFIDDCIFATRTQICNCNFADARYMLKKKTIAFLFSSYFHFGDCIFCKKKEPHKVEYITKNKMACSSTLLLNAQIDLFVKIIKTADLKVWKKNASILRSWN